MAKYALLRDRLARDPRIRLETAELAHPADIERAHDPAYVRAVMDGTLDPRIVRRIGFPWSDGLVRRTLASVGGTLAAARKALSTGLGANLAGGTHHAFRDEGSGFCVFNDLAVAVYSLAATGEAARFAVLDLDVHQGDGTAAIFHANSDVLTVSLHGANNFPFRKQSSNIDVPLADATEDDAYLRSLAQVLPEVWSWRPDLLLYQAGVDGLREDRLGRLALTLDGIRERDQIVLQAAKGRNIPIVITLGGGYADPLELTVEAHANTFLTAASLWTSE